MKMAEAAPAPARFVPVRPKSLPESVAEQLREAILSGQVKPGERLIEQKLAVLFGIGQPTVREALKQLEHQGFVTKLPNRATFVTDLSEADMEKMFDVRMVLETLAIERAAPRITPDSMEILRGHLADMEIAAQVMNLSAFQQCDIAFHHAIWDLSGNEYLATALDRIVPALFAFVLLKRHGNREGYLASIRQHQEILEGLATGDPIEARQAFRRSTQGYWHLHHKVRIADA